MTRALLLPRHAIGKRDHRCVLLEQRGITPNTTDVVWRWNDA